MVHCLRWPGPVGPVAPFLKIGSAGRWCLTSLWSPAICYGHRLPLSTFSLWLARKIYLNTLSWKCGTIPSVQLWMCSVLGHHLTSLPIFINGSMAFNLLIHQWPPGIRSRKSLHFHHSYVVSKWLSCKSSRIPSLSLGGTIALVPHGPQNDPVKQRYLVLSSGLYGDIRVWIGAFISRGNKLQGVLIWFFFPSARAR